LDIANGSLAEVGYLIRVARDLNYMTPKDWETLEGLRDKAGKSVWGLYDSIRRRTLRT
jgi:four helix bundle protein